MLAKPAYPVIVDYGSGNLRSVAKAFEYVNGGNLLITNQPSELAAASHIILPGVGAFGACKDGLSSIPGLVGELTKQVIERKKPFLGICVGMHLMATQGLEHGETPGLDWISGKVTKLRLEDNNLKIPHMGWNELIFCQRTHPILRDFETGVHAYFVHSYYSKSQDLLVLMEAK